MLMVYFLPVEIIDGTEKVTGEDVIHDALLLTTIDPGTRKLIMDTTPDEHNALQTWAILTDAPTPEEEELYHSQVIILPPDPETLLAQELLSHSPDAITLPDVWTLLRIFGRRLGYDFTDTSNWKPLPEESE